MLSFAIWFAAFIFVCPCLIKVCRAEDAAEPAAAEPAAAEPAAAEATGI